MANGLIAALLVFIVIVVGILGIISVSSSFEDQLNTSDKVNTTGIYTNGSAPYNVTTGLTHSFMDSAPAGILLAFLLVVIMIILIVWVALKKGGE